MYNLSASKIATWCFWKIAPPARPYPDETNEGHYQIFQAVYGTKTTEKLKPPKKQQIKSMVSLSSHIKWFCIYCKKPRVVYSKNKVSKNITKSKRQTLELQFVCGTTIEELVGPDAFTDLMSGKIYDVTQPLK